MKSGRTAKLAGTTILAALVVVFDYTLKFSGLKIPFPWAPFLKFDFTGIPIVLALLLYGLSSGGATSFVACIAIIARSGDVVGATSKAIAEFATVSGMAAGLRLSGRYRKAVSVIVGVATRIMAMSLANLIILPVYYGMPQSVAVDLLPLIGAFNALQGGMTVLVGYGLYEAFIRRVPMQTRYTQAK
jgi:riboflavin transporter FmnP